LTVAIVDGTLRDSPFGRGLARFTQTLTAR
jgi:hypothetical protein